jgi:hypothetical protein
MTGSLSAPRCAFKPILSHLGCQVGVHHSVREHSIGDIREAQEQTCLCGVCSGTIKSRLLFQAAVPHPSILPWRATTIAGAAPPLSSP